MTERSAERRVRQETGWLAGWLAPLRSPDLTPPDYFLWGYLKGRFYQNKPRTLDALKANITEEIQAVTADVLARPVRPLATSSTRYDVVTFLTQ
jgi:hypothetical protein